MLWNEYLRAEGRTMTRMTYRFLFLSSYSSARSERRGDGDLDDRGMFRIPLILGVHLL